MLSTRIKILIASCCGVLALSSSITTLFFMKGEETTTKTPSSQKEEYTEEQQKVISIRDTLLNNLNKSNINFNDLNLKAIGLGGENKELDLTFNGAIDYYSFMDTRQDDDSSNNLDARFNGNINLKYLDKSNEAKYPTQLDEDLSINYKGSNKLYIDFYNQKYTVSGNLISDVLDFLPLLIDDFESYDSTIESIKSLDIVELLPMITSVLGSFSLDSDIDQTPVIEKNKEIYTFNLVIDQDIISSAGIDLGLSQDIKIILKCDENGLLTYLGIEPIEMSNITIYLEANTSMSLTTTYTSDFDEESYTNDLDCIGNAFTYISTLVNQKQFSFDYTLVLDEYNDSVKLDNSHLFNGEFKGDVSLSDDFVNDATYDISIDESTDFANEVKARYLNNEVYLSFNNSIKAKVGNTDLEDFITVLENAIGEDKLNESLNSISTILSFDTINEIIDGNYSKYKEILKSLTVNNEVLDIEINAGAFGLPNEYFDLTLDLSNDTLNSINVKSLPFLEENKADGTTSIYKVSLALNIKDYVESEYNYEEYANIKMVTPLTSTLLKIVDDKKVGIDYSFLTTQDSERLNLNGDINVDVSSSNFDINTFNINDPINQLKDITLGNIELSGNTIIDEKERNLKVNYQDSSLYLDYYGASKDINRTALSLKKDTFFSIYDSLDLLLNKSSDDEKEVQTLFSETDDLLNTLLNFSDGKLWNILKSTEVKKYSDYISLFNPESSDILTVSIDSKIFNKDYGTIYLSFDKNSENLASLEAKLNSSSWGEFKISLDFKEYDESSLLLDSDIEEFKEIDTTFENIKGIFEGNQNSLEISSTLKNSEDKEKELYAFMNLKFNKWESISNGLFKIVDNSNTDSDYEFDHKIEYDVSDTGIELEYNDSIQAKTSLTNIKEALLEFSTLTNDSLIYTYIEDYLPIINYLSGATSELKLSTPENLKIENIIASLLTLNLGIEIEPYGANQIRIGINTNQLNNVINANDSMYTYNKNSDDITYIVLDLEPNEANAYMSIIFEDVEINGYSGDIKTLISLDTIESSDLSFEDDIGCIDLSDLPILTKCGIKATQRGAYSMNGSLTMKTSSVASLIIDCNIDFDVTCKIIVGDEILKDGLFDVKCLIDFKGYGEETKGNYTLFKGYSYSKNYITSSIYVYKGDIYFKRQLDKWEKPASGSYSATGTSTFEYSKIKKEDFISNILYYLISYALDNNTVYEKINSYINQDTSIELNDVLKWIKSFGLIETGCFQLNINILSIFNIYLDIYYNEDDYDLSRVHAYFTFMSMIDFDIDVTNEANITKESLSEFEEDFDSFISNFTSNSNTSSLLWRDNISSTSEEYIFTSSESIF